MKKICIDAGHGGYDFGSTYNGRNEKDDNLKLAMAVGKELKDKGMDVVYTRTSDIYQSPNEKAQIANDNKADMMLSLHRSSSPVPNTYEGVEALIYNKGDWKEKVANEMTDGLEDVGFGNMGTDVRKNLAVLRRTNMPAILLDVGFINTDQDNVKFDQYFNEIVQAIVDAIQNRVAKEEEEPKEAVDVSYHVQVGLFKNYNNAINLRNKLLEEGYDAFVWPIGGLTAVLVGKYKELSEAEQTEESLSNAGYDTIVITV